MKRFSAWASLIFLILCLFVFLGCGGGDGSTTSDGKLGRVEGYTYLQSGIIVLGNSATPPAGATALSGATLTIDGKSGTATTDSTGKFLVTDVPIGQRKLHVNGAGAPILDVPLTVIKSATIQTGEFAIDRAEARDIVTTAAASLGTVANFQILATQQPLPAGTVVKPALGGDDATDDPALVITLDAPHYLFFVDQQPGARFQHPATNYFVNANTGAVTTRTVSSWPRINEVGYYADDDKNAMAQDLIQPGTRKARLARQKVEKVDAEITQVIRSRSRDHVPGATDPKTYALFIQGNTRSDFAADIPNVQSKLFGAGGLSGNVEISTWKPTGEVNRNAKKQVLDLYNAICAKARAEDTILVYITAHGAKEGAFFLQQGGEDDGSVVPSDYIFPDVEMDTSKCATCHVIFIIDTCFSGQQLSRMADKLPHAGQKLTVLAASTSLETSAGITNFWATVTFSDAGGVFTNAFLKSLKEYSEAHGGAGQSNLPEIFDSAVTAMDSDVQHPQKVFLWDGTSCGAPQTLISVTPATVTAKHTVGSTPCPQSLGSVTLKNVSDKTISYTLTLNSTYFNLSGGMTGTLTPGQTKALPLSFNCGKVPPLEANIGVTATVQGASQSQSLSVPITLSNGP